MSVLTAPSTAHGQGTAGRFVLGPLQWTPTIQLREAGIDSNVFITPDDVRQDVSGSFLSQVDSMLTLGIGRVSTQGSAEYVYFDRYKSQRSVNGKVSSRMDFALSRLRPAATVAWAHLKERANSEIDIRAPRRDLGYGASLAGRLTSRLAMTAAVTHDATAYDAGYAFRGADLALQLNRDTTNIVVGIRADISPFTSFFIDGGAGRDGFTAQRSRNTDNFRANAGLQFAPDAVNNDPDQFSLDPDVARLLTNAAYTLMPELAVPLATPLVLASSLVFLRTGLMPRWVGWVGLFVTLVSFAGFLVGPTFLFAWILLVAVYLALRPPRSTSA